MSYSFREFCPVCASEQTHELSKKSLDFQVGDEVVDLIAVIETCGGCQTETASNNADLTVLAYKKSSTPCPQVTISRQLAIDADSEFSAMAHGRPMTEEAELKRLSFEFRKAYEG